MKNKTIKKKHINWLKLNLIYTVSVSVFGMVFFPAGIFLGITSKEKRKKEETEKG